MNLNTETATIDGQAVTILNGVNNLGDHLRLIDANADLALYGIIPAGNALPLHGFRVIRELPDGSFADVEKPRFDTLTEALTVYTKAVTESLADA